MDPIAHTLVGATLAETGLKRRSRFATAALVIGANLPDIDALFYFLSSDSALAHRRGWTHGVLAMIVLPLVLVAVLLVIDRFRRGGSDGGPGPNAAGLLVLSAAAVWSHPLLDWLNTYGVRLLMPFDGRWFYGDTLFIVDPWLWLLLAAVLLLVAERWLQAAAIAVLAVGTLLLFVSPVPALAAAIWVSAILAVLMLRWRWGQLLGGRSGERLARLAIAVLLLYALSMLAATRVGRQLVHAQLEVEGLEVESLMVGPLPAVPWAREVVAATGGVYRVGLLRWWRRPHFELVQTIDAGGLSSPVAAAALAADCVRGLVGWARFPFVEVEIKGAEGAIVYVLDARYTRRRTRGFGGARVLVDRGDAPRCDG